MKTEIDLAGEKEPLLTNTSFFNKSKVKFLQIKARHHRTKMMTKQEKR